MKRKTLLAGLLVLVVLLILGPRIATRMIAGSLNRVVDQVFAPPSEEALRLHQTLLVADLHADAMLWDRNLLRRSGIGHVDVPRMIEGRVGLQGFTSVIQTPADINIDANTDDTDQIRPLAMVQGWPPRTWSSNLERAIHQADKLRAFADASDGALRIVTTRAELFDFLTARDWGEAAIAGFLGIEGAHALEGDLSNVDRVFEAGYRMVGLTHFFDNAIGGSAHGVGRGGLTELGRSAIDRMQELGMAIDLAHASTALIDDVLDRATTPLLVSHTGVKGTCDNARTLDDGRLERIAATGGVVGIGLWETVLCGTTPDDWARAVRHSVTVAGIDHVALGSDWDGAVTTVVDASGTAHLTQALLREGFADDEIRRIMGGNVVRVLAQTLPPGA